MSFLQRKRLYFLVASLLLTGASAAVAPMLPMTADVTEFLPSDDPAAAFWVDLTERFGALDLLMVGLEEPDEPFRIESLQRLSRITDRLAERKAEGILLSRSLTNLDNIEQGEDGTIHAGLLLDRLPENDADREAVMERVLANPQALGSFVSRELRAYVLILKLDPEKDSRKAAQLVRAIVESERGDLAAAYFGAPFIETMITDQVYRQVPLVASLFLLLLLVPVVMLVRRVVPVLLIFGCAGVAVLWWLGLLALLRVELTATASGAALVLVAVAAVLYARLVQQRLEGAGPREIPAIRLLGLVVAAGAGLFLLLLFPVPFLAHFGQVAGIGMAAVALAAILLVVPASTFVAPREPRGAGPSPRRIRPAVAAAVTVAMLAGGGYAASRGRFVMSPRDLFAADDEVGRAMAFFDRHLGGADVLQISVRGDLRKPANAMRLMRLTDLLQGEALFADVRSVTQVLGMLSEQFGGIHRIPVAPEALNNLWFFLEGNPDVRPLVNDDRNDAMIAARIFPQTDLAMARWVQVAEDAVARSLEQGRDAATERLLALGRAQGLMLRRQAVADLLDQTLAEASPERQAKRLEATVDRLGEFMRSDEAPFEPSETEWKTLRGLLLRGASKEELQQAVVKMEGFIEWEYPPEVAGELAETLRARISERGRADQLGKPMEQLAALVGSGAGSEGFLGRARGVLTELLDPAAAVQDDLEIVVSGFPAVIARAEQPVLHAVWMSALLLWGVMLLAVLVVTRSGGIVLRSGLEALLATVLTFGVAWLTRTPVDSASAVLYLLPPVAAFFASPALCRGRDDHSPLPGNRYAPAVAVSLAAGSLSLLVTGVMPVFRIGAVMAIALGLVASIAPLSRRVR